MDDQRAGQAVSALQALLRVLPPLIFRTTWGNFEYRMHRVLKLDIQLEMGEVTREELEIRQATLVLSSFSYPNRPASDYPDVQFYMDETSIGELLHIDEYATQPRMPV